MTIFEVLFGLVAIWFVVVLMIKWTIRVFKGGEWAKSFADALKELFNLGPPQ